MVDELLSDERLLEPLNDFPLNAAPLLLRCRCRTSASSDPSSAFGSIGCFVQLKLRDESLLEDERDCPDELLDDMLREDDDPLLPLLLDERPPWLDRSFLSSLSRAMAKLAVRKTDRRPMVATHLKTRLRRIWGTFLFGRLIQSPTLP